LSRELKSGLEKTRLKKNKPNPHEFYCFFFGGGLLFFWALLIFLLLAILALCQCLAHAGVLKNTQG